MQRWLEKHKKKYISFRMFLEGKHVGFHASFLHRTGDRPLLLSTQCLPHFLLSLRHVANRPLSSPLPLSLRCDLSSAHFLIYLPASFQGVQPRQLELLGSLGWVHQDVRRRGEVRPAPVQQPAAAQQRALLHGEESHLPVLQRHAMSASQ